MVDLWIDHWSCIGMSPPVAMATIEQAILARTFFDPANLLVALSDGQVRAWCHVAVDRYPEEAGQKGDLDTGFEHEHMGRMLAICFSPNGGLEVCEPLLAAAEARVKELGCHSLRVGLVRDGYDGYVGLPPIGHGIGVPEADTRTTSLLTQAGYTASDPISRLVVSTSPYRPPVNREALQLRRTTRGVREPRMPVIPRLASAFSHFDIECHKIVDHRTGEMLAQVELWCSDVEAQVMNCAHAILDLSPLENPDRLSGAESFLIGSLIQTLSDRRIYAVETAVNSDRSELIRQLETLQFENTEKGHQWQKKLV
ncbi:hypothetical protein [Novipirellula sp.]|uniref:hypothetical protein n=1 Tax=Novipirellula sp. TaxID=2795430 RepID=UPI003568468C